jgi:hypothetical protein
MPDITIAVRMDADNGILDYYLIPAIDVETRRSVWRKTTIFA